MLVATLDQIRKDVISYLDLQGNASVVTRLNDKLLLAINDAVNEIAHMLKWNASTKEVSATVIGGEQEYTMPANLNLSRITSVHVKVEGVYWRDVQLEFDQERIYTEPQDTYFKRYRLLEDIGTGVCKVELSPPCIEDQEIRIKYITGLDRMTDGCDRCPMPADLVKLYATYLMKVSLEADDAQTYLSRFNAILARRKADYSDMPDIIKKKTQSRHIII
jgi:hypothetical protein